MKKRYKKGTVAEIMHPDYRVLITDYNKWRLCYQGGRRFISSYLKRHSKRESALEFQERKFMTYCPSFAKAAINEIINSIYQRLVDIKRIGGDDSYKEAIEGRQGGVDLHGSSMANFMGQAVLKELLPMKKVGIYIDMPKLSGETVLETYQARPYMYYYCAEDIRTWSYQYQNGQYQYNNVLLRDAIQLVDPETGMPHETTHRWRRVWLDEDGVHIKFFDEGGEPDGQQVDLPHLSRLPFITLELTDSLMIDICDYQIALLNLQSTDLNYLMKANFPFYTEEFDPRAENIYNDRPVNAEGPSTNNDEGNSKEIVIGNVNGRRFPMGFKAPAFIHPSSEPLKASIEKQTQMKGEIRELVGLALATLQPIHASAESKQQDQGTMESGLSAIGLTMEYAEREIAKVWAMYLGKDEEDAAKVNYPRKYSLISSEDRRADAAQLSELLPIAPSILYKKAIAKQIACALLERKVDDDDLKKIHAEIDAAPYIDGTAMDVQQDVVAGIVSSETASLARGYKNAKQEVAKAKEEKNDSLAMIAKHQAPKPTQGVSATQPPGGGNKGPDGEPLNPGAGRPPAKDGE